ncbi:MAG TPA: hypothetical protein VFH99_00750 [Candidatus Saccharimonadales bacterium]|nr:hypothetical protein [Candidatus Saccharimonadales bacterium]
MSKKSNIIEINGKRYDAHSGAPLDHVPTAINVRPIVVHHQASETPPATPRHHATRPHAKPVHRHAPQRSTTLMRKAVRKPSANLKRHTKAQSHTGTLAKQPAAEVIPKLSFGTPNAGRLQRAVRVSKSKSITHFNFNRTSSSGSARVVPITVNRPGNQSHTPPKPTPKAVPAQSSPDIDAIFERAIQQATSHLEPAPKTHKKRRLHLTRKHARA